MRKVMIPSLVACFLVGLVSQVWAADEPQDIIAKAIQAAGGEAKLNKVQAVQTKTKGKIEFSGGRSFTQEVTYQVPNKFRDVTHVDDMGKQTTVTTVFNGKEGWFNVQGQTHELKGKLL